MSNQVTRRWPPLNEEEKAFVSFWEEVRDKNRKWTYLLLHNLPRGIIFGVPIALFFFIEAPRHRGLISHGDLELIMAGILLIAVFYAILRGYIKWDQQESHYQILKMRDGSRDPDTGSPEAGKDE